MALPKAKKKKAPLPRRPRTGLAGIPVDESWDKMHYYFHFELDKKSTSGIYKDYIKKNYTKAQQKKILACPEYCFTMYSHYALAIYWMNLGREFDEKHKDYGNGVKRYIKSLEERGAEILKEKKAEVKKKENIIVLTPQQKLRRKINHTIMVDLDDLEDKWIEGDKDATINVYHRFQYHGLTGQAVQYVRDRIEGWRADYFDAYHKKCEQAVEGYSHLKRIELRKRLKACDEMLADLDRIKSAAKANRKPRTPKVVTADRQIAKLNYKKDDKDFKLVSVNPMNIIGQYRLYTFNVKQKILTEYISSSPKGFECRGSTLQQINFEESRQVRLRKPMDFLPIVQEKTPKQIDVAWKKLTTKTSQPNARINKDTILVRVMAK